MKSYFFLLIFILFSSFVSADSFWVRPLPDLSVFGLLDDNNLWTGNNTFIGDVTLLDVFLKNLDINNSLILRRNDSSVYANFTEDQIVFSEKLFVNNDLEVSGDLIVNDSIIVDSNITINDRINFINASHFLKFGSDKWNDIATNAFWFADEDVTPTGDMQFMVTNIDKILFWLQVGQNNSASMIGNSLMIVPNSMANDSFNRAMGNASNCLNVYSIFGMQQRIICDSSDGADGFITGDWHVWDALTIGDPNNLSSLLSFGAFDIILNGDDADFINGSIHIATPIIFESGFSVGDIITNLQALFLGFLSPFINQQVDIGNWEVVTDASGLLCDSNQCAQANGAGSGNIIMEANFNTVNSNETMLHFVYSLIDMTGGNSFDVEIDDGGGFVNIFSDGGTDSVVPITIDLGESFSNLSSVDLRFICDTNNIARLCFVDSIIVNGSAIISTLANQSGFNSEICFSDGLRDVNNECNRGIFYSVEDDTTFIKGTVNFTGTIVGGISGSGTANNIPLFASSTSLTNSIISQSSGNIIIAGDLGIGTSSLQQELSVNGQIRLNATTPGIQFEESDTSNTNFQIDVSGGDLSFRTMDDNFGNAVTRMIILDNGRVGVGNAVGSPENIFSIENGSAGGQTFMDLNNNNVNQFLKMGINGNVAEIGYDNNDALHFGIYDTTADNSLTTYMTILSGGNIGIGDSSPSVQLDVNSGGANEVANFISTDTFGFIEVTDSGGTLSLCMNNGDIYIRDADCGGNIYFIKNSTSTCLRSPNGLNELCANN